MGLKNLLGYMFSSLFTEQGDSLRKLYVQEIFGYFFVTHQSKIQIWEGS